MTRNLPGEAIAKLKKKHTVQIYPKDKVIPRKKLLKGVKWCDVLLCLLTDKIDKEVIDANPNLKMISNYAVGFNNIDVKYATEKGIPITNTPGQAIVDAVAEHTFALMLAVSKRVVEADTFTRKKKYRGWSPTLLMGTELTGKTLGIIGLGRIGTGVAERAGHGLGMKVIYHDVRRDKKFEKKYKAQFVPLNKLLKNSDFITLHVPLLKSTRHLIGAKELKMMKKTSFLINTSRGPVVDEKALVSALKKRQIAGAGLDVYEFEPKLAPGLTRLQNVVLTPHIASATIEARSEMAWDAVNNILAVLSGKKAAKTVNPEVYKKNNK